jgi:hypothetical protein
MASTTVIWRSPARHTGGYVHVGTTKRVSVLFSASGDRVSRSRTDSSSDLAISDVRRR